MPHDHDRDQPNYYRAGYFPRRFVSLAKEIQRKPKGTPTQKDNEAADDAPLVVETRRLAGVTRQLVIWTCVIAGVGVLAFFASLLQWDAMRGQLGEMRTADINANRAFVVAKGLDAYPVKAADNSVIWNISVIFENSGNSPTERLIVNANPCLSGGSNGLPRDFSFPDFSVEKVPILLGPKNQASLKPIAIDPFMMQTMEKKGGIMHIYGKASYGDRISTQPRTTEYCFVLNGFRGDMTTINGQIAYSPCWTHNCADDECVEQDRTETRSDSRKFCAVEFVVLQQKNAK